MPFRRVAVLAGAGAEASPEATEAAAHLGRLLAENAITLIYDGEGDGLAGALAETMQEGGGKVIVMARGAEMVERADGFLALPGGLGTLEELFTITAWQNPADPEKPFGLLNVAGCFTALLAREPDALVERFVRESQRGALIVDRDPASLLRTMADFRPPETRRNYPREEA